jgi:hypothetical protein
MIDIKRKKGYGFYYSVTKNNSSFASAVFLAVSAVTVIAIGPNPNMRPVFIVIDAPG